MSALDNTGILSWMDPASLPMPAGIGSSSPVTPEAGWMDGFWRNWSVFMLEDSVCLRVCVSAQDYNPAPEFWETSPEAHERRRLHERVQIKAVDETSLHS
ncbi:unnamed protein product [Pleuronectes platessa]|uniref:Uncharacterized protein n=1 Tax=Pleuronectes platessa TaxID=8262 RepID=A0A9N7Z7D3_PLEPL|nr:unnamed protein product [Pleuronectes platessa]